MNRNALIVFGCAVLCAACPAEMPAYTYVEIVVPGLTSAQAAGINNHGDIVGYGTGSSGTVGFLDSGGTFTLLSFPGSTSTKPAGINDAGDIVGSYKDAAGTHGFKYTAGNFTTMDAPAPAAANSTILTGINNVGQIVGFASIPLPANTCFCTHGFVLTAGVFRFSDEGLNSYDMIEGINDAGVFVGSDGGQLSPGFPLDSQDGGPHSNGSASFPTGSFTAINDGGQVILEYAGTHVQSSPAQTTTGAPIVFPGAKTTSGSGINNAADVVGTWFDSANQPHAFVAVASAPECSIGNSSGQMNFSVQDGSGLSQIVVTKSINASTNIPGFVAGATSPILVTSTANNPLQSASVTLMATNTSGLSSACTSRISGTHAQWSGLGGILSSNTVVGVNSDGSLDAFALGSDGTLWHIAQSGPGGPWGAWGGFGGTAFAGEPAVALDRSGLLEILVVAPDGSLWQTAQTAPASWAGATWQNIASGVKGRPALIKNGNGDLQAFVRSNDDSVMALTQSSPGSASWAALSLGGIITSNPAAVLWTSTAEVVAIGTDQALWTTSLSNDGTVSAWQSAGSSLNGDPAIILQLGIPVICARGIDDAVWLKVFFSNNWQSLGGEIVDNPRLVVNTDNRAEVFVAGTDNEVWHTAQTYGGDNHAPWSAWSTLGGVITGDVVPAVDASGAVNIFVRGSDSGLWYLTQPTPGFWQ